MMIGGVSRVTDHIEQGLDRLLEQFKGKPLLASWAKAYLRQCQLLENASYDVIIKRMLDVATGEQLDVLGRIVGEVRRGRSDFLFGIFIRARIRINRSKGTLQDMFDMLDIITVVPHVFAEYYPASLSVEFLEETEYDPVLILSMLRDAKAGGVGLTLVVPTVTPEFQFLWSSVGDLDVADNGFGDAGAPDDFGLLSDAVTMRGEA